MNSDTIKLITTFVQDGLMSLSRRGAGKIVQSGKTENDGLAFIYNFDDKRYMISIDEYIEPTQPSVSKIGDLINNTSIPE